MARLDEHVAAAQVAPFEAVQVDGDALPRLGALDGLVVHLDGADAHRPPRGLEPQLVARGDRSRSTAFPSRPCRRRAA